MSVISSSATSSAITFGTACVVVAATMQPAKKTSECWIPLQYGQRPETTIPPSTGRPLPRGAQTPAAIRRGSPNSSARLSSGR